MEKTTENLMHVKQGTMHTKLPNSARKKRLLSIQARHLLADKDKCVQMNFTEYDNADNVSKHKNFQPILHGVSEKDINNTKIGSMSSCELERCASFPEVSLRTLNFPLIKSGSLPLTNTQNFNTFSLKTNASKGSQRKMADTQPEKVALNSLPSKYIPVDDPKSIYAVSQQSCPSSTRARTESVDSTFSQISISEVKEIASNIKNKPLSSTENFKRTAQLARSKSDASHEYEQFEIIDENEFSSLPSSINEVKEIASNIKSKPLSSTENFKRTAQHARSKSDASHDYEQFEFIDENETSSLPSSFSEKLCPQRKSIFEGKQMPVQTECFFPRPQQGQSLTSFLSSTDFNISAELDRENAHFCISEALISAIEHMKCSRTMKIIEEEEESDEEIRKLTQRIRIRRKEKHIEKSIKSIVLLSDGKTDTTTSQSASPPLSSHSSDFEVDSIGSEDEVEDIELSANVESSLSSMKESGLSLSMASLYSDADLQKALLKREADRKFQESGSNNLSAESVALSLIRRFSEKHLPKASDLQWIVSEQEAPQRLLPLPNSWPVSPDVIEEEYSSENTRLRGTFEWAPPRPQIIFCLLPNLKRKDIMEKQKYRCAGCGMKIEKSYISRFRYCNYFGKYFCQCCHSNSLAYIPSRILWKWDFTKQYVSKFAFDLLDQMFFDPLFNIEGINSSSYKKFRQLEQSRICRMQLFYLKDFMRTCRKAQGIQELLEKQNQYILSEPHMYSLSDLVQVKSGEFLKSLRPLLNPCLGHVLHCILCQAKGFVCEVCQKEKDIIFPFELQRVVLCDVCGSCFHKSCFKNKKCPRCVRIAERKKRLKEEKNPREIFV